MLAAGAERVVIGTAALRDPEFLDRALAEHGERVVVSVDARGGRVSLSGWTEGTERDAAATVAELAARGVERFLCTEIDVDGTMEGPAVAELGRICAATDAAVIASGGVGTLADLRALAALGAPVRTSRARSSAARCTSGASPSPRGSRRSGVTGRLIRGMPRIRRPTTLRACC